MDKVKRTKRPFRISRGTVVIILVLIVVFVVWNYWILPSLFKVSEVKNITLPPVKRGNIEFIDKQINNRTLQVPTLAPPQGTLGKQNPFE